MSDANRRIIEEFRANHGDVGGPFEGRPLLLLHTKGARSGSERVTPLTYLEEDGRIFVFASRGGSDHHPDWYHNLVATPAVTYEIGDEVRSATARAVEGSERDRIYARQAAAWSVFARYEAGTERRIPVIELDAR
jgi:deazaflavin-dependent oxidoreductase (nitroreductase family)